jgi:UPF0271 protein
VSRSKPGAVIHDVEEVVARVSKMVTEGKVTAINGEELEVKVDTICLHGDTSGAATLARILRQNLEAAGIDVVPMGNFL